MSDYSDAYQVAREAERERITQIIEQETVHYGKTHYEGINCVVCRIMLRIGETDE